MRATVALLVLCACSGGGGSNYSPPPPPPPPPPTTGPSAISGASPFAAGCGGTGGTLYAGAEVEPHGAIDPLDANHWIAAWQQDRWSNGSARGIVAAVTFDGGATWTTQAMPFSQCAGGTDVRATDPWLSFGAEGHVYQAAVATTGGTFAAGSSNAVLVSRSLDGGRTWQAPVAVIRDGESAFNDKETVTADPRDARYAYAVWDRLVKGQNIGPAYFSRTVDGGASWEPARAIYDPGNGLQTIGNLVRVLPDGTLVNLMAVLATESADEDKAATDSSLAVIRSTDHGATWSAPIRVADFKPLGARDPLTGAPIRDGSILPQMAAAPDGTLYVVWQDGRFAVTHDAIALSRSTDGGLTWSTPVRVNSEPGVVAFTAQVHVRGDGAVAVTYFDLRSRSATDPAVILADYWLARSTDGITWSETHVAGPFDLAIAPLAGGALFLGDYMGLEDAGGSFVPFYTRTTGDIGNRTDVFAQRIDTGKRAMPYAAQPLAAARDAGVDRRAAGNLRQALAQRRTAR